MECKSRAALEWRQIGQMWVAEQKFKTGLRIWDRKQGPDWAIREEIRKYEAHTCIPDPERPHELGLQLDHPPRRRCTP